jgi:hypothetical protein
MMRRLREYEGPRCLWRPVACAAVFATVVLLPLAGWVGEVYIVANGQSLALVIIGVGVALILTALADRFRKREPWRALVVGRLWTFEKPDAVQLALLVGVSDLETAARELRHAKFNPFLERLIGAPPDDAPELNGEILVYRPEAWHPEMDHKGFKEGVKAALSNVDLRARVSGDDIYPAQRSRITDRHDPPK